MEKNSKKYSLWNIYRGLSMAAFLLTDIFVLFFAYRNIIAEEPSAPANMHEAAEIFSLLIIIAILRSTLKFGRKRTSYFLFLNVFPFALMWLLVLDEACWLLFESSLVSLPLWANLWFVLPVSLEVFFYCISLAKLQERREKLSGSVHQLLSGNVTKELEMGKTGGMKDLTAVFVRLHNYETRMKDVEPSRRLSILRQFLSESAGILERHGGTVLEFPGHCVFAVFGAPGQLPGHEEKAVEAALVVREEMNSLVAICEALCGVTLGFGVGIASGPAHMGSIGGENRKRFSVIGRTVNMAGRVESYTADGEILVAEGTKEKLTGSFTLASAGKYQPKGLEKEVEFFRVEKAEK